MTAATLRSINLKHGQSVGQTLNQQIDNIEEPERLIRFLESMPSDSLNDPGNLLGFIYQRVTARQGRA